MSKPGSPGCCSIDDEPALAEFVANRCAGMRLRGRLSRRTTRHFREKFLEERPDMVALDLGMPGMDGVELLRFLADEDLTARRC